MKEKMYIVLEDQKYTGKHRVYKAGQQFPESELSGNAENKRMALEGAKDTMGKFDSTKDENGKTVEGKEYIAIKGSDPKIKPIAAPQKKGSKK